MNVPASSGHFLTCPVRDLSQAPSIIVVGYRYVVASAIFPVSTMRLQSGVDARTGCYIRAVEERSFGGNKRPQDPST